MEFRHISMELSLSHAQHDFLLAIVGVRCRYADDGFHMDLLDFCIPRAGTDTNDLCILPVCHDCHGCHDSDMPENLSGDYAFTNDPICFLFQQDATNETDAHFEAAKVEN